MQKNVVGDAVTLKRILLVAWPAMITFISINIMQFSDRLFLARYHITHFTASLPAGIYSLTVISLFLGIIGYVTALASQYFGSNQKTQCAQTAWQGVYLALGAGILIAFSAPLTGKVFELLRTTDTFSSSDVMQKNSLVALQKTYFYLMLGSGVCMLLGDCFSGFFNGIGRTSIPMAAAVASNGLNVLLNWIFIFGKFGFPEMGIHGAGLATLICSFIGLVVRIFFFLNKRFDSEYKTKTTWKFCPAIFRKLVRFGLPSGINYFINIGAFGFFILLIGRISEYHQAACNIAFTLESVAFMPVLGLAIGISVVAGQEMGANRKHNVGRVLKKGILTAAVYNLILSVLFLFFPDMLLSIFSNPADLSHFTTVSAMALPLIRITALWLIFDAVLIVICEVLRTAGDTMFLLFLTGGMSVAALVFPGWFYTVYLKGTDLRVLWMIIVVFVCILTAAASLRYRQGRWKKMNIIE